MRKSPSTAEFKQAMNDEKVKSLYVQKWKPLHLMIYFGRIRMIDEILNFSGRSLRKAMTIENKKTLTGDEYFPIRLAIKLNKKDIFKSLWNLAHQWSIVHLYQVIKDLIIPTLYSEDILILLLTDKTTQDIVAFSDNKIRKELFTMLQDIIEENGGNKKRLNALLSKLKKAEPKEMNIVIEGSSERTHTDFSGDMISDQ